MPTVEHEKLRVYARAVDAAVLLEKVASIIPPFREDLRDQLRRASASIPLNVAEGASEFSPAEKARFYRIARRSCAECLSILDVLSGIMGTSPALESGREPLKEVMGMLTTMVLRRAQR